MGVTEVVKTRLTREDKVRVSAVTHAELLSEWLMIRDLLIRERQTKIAADIQRFVAEMPAPETDKEVIAAGLKSRVPDRTRSPAR
jgi:hypothetical protein